MWVLIKCACLVCIYNIIKYIFIILSYKNILDISVNTYFIYMCIYIKERSLSGDRTEGLV